MYYKTMSVSSQACGSRQHCAVSGTAGNVAGTLSDTVASYSRPRHIKSQARSNILLGASILTTRHLKVLPFQLMATQRGTDKLWNTWKCPIWLTCTFCCVHVACGMSHLQKHTLLENHRRCRDTPQQIHNWSRNYSLTSWMEQIPPSEAVHY
jgi:hypothetical protein